MKTHELNIKKVFRAEQVRIKPYYDLHTYWRELVYAESVLKIHSGRVSRWIHGKDDGSTFNTEFKELMAEIVELGEVPKPRREAMQDYYKRSLEKFDDPKDRMIFIQGIAAMDDGEELNLGDMYTDDFNAALLKYKEANGDE